MPAPMDGQGPCTSNLSCTDADIISNRGTKSNSPFLSPIMLVQYTLHPFVPFRLAIVTLTVDLLNNVFQFSDRISPISLSALHPS